MLRVVPAIKEVVQKVTSNDDEDDDYDVSKFPIRLIFLFHLSNLNF